MTPPLASSTPPSSTNNLPGSFYKFFVETKKIDLAGYTTGAQEKKYLGIIENEWDVLPRQMLFSGLNDAAFEEFVRKAGVYPLVNEEGEPVDKAAINPETGEEEIYGGYLRPDSIDSPGTWLLVVHYPQGTGSVEVDAILKKWAKENFIQGLPLDPENLEKLNPFSWFAQIKYPEDKADYFFYELKMQFVQAVAVKRLLAFMGINEFEKYDFANSSFSYPLITTYLVSRPSKAGSSESMPAGRYMTIIFTDWSYYGGAHENWHSEAMSFDLQTGKELGIKDILPESEKYLPLLQARLGELVNEKVGYSDLPSAFQALFNDPAETDITLKKMILAPEGLIFIFDPYEVASFSEGTIFITIPKEELAELGVDMRFWE